MSRRWSCSAVRLTGGVKPPVSGAVAGSAPHAPAAANSATAAAMRSGERIERFKAAVMETPSLSRTEDALKPKLTSDLAA